MGQFIGSFYNDPLGFVWAVFPWGEKGSLLEREEGPDAWQTAVLDTLGQQLRERADHPEAAVSAAIRLAVASGHGIGKTALVAWIILWFVSTRPTPQIVVTANTDTQLRTKTWRELSKWHELAIHRSWFQWTATQFKFRADPTKWYATATPWSENNATAFAGTHERHVLLLFDEASEIADVIWETAEGAQTTAGAGNTIIWAAFGNPTQNTGRFRECWRKFRKRWITLNVDSRTARKANKQLIEEWRQDYGEDSDFFKVRVRGEFPAQGPTQFIGSDLVDAAIKRKFEDGWIAPTTPKLMGVDVARQGDDSSVIVRRWGPQMMPDIKRYRIPDLMQIASRVAEQINLWKPDTCFIDAVGMGAGVYDRLVQLGYADVVVPAHGGDMKEVLEPNIYYNPRIEWWARMREWLKTASIPDDRELFEDLIGPQYSYDLRMKMRLERKEDMKARGVPSPDCFVAGTLIETPHGPIPIERLKVGDVVLTPFGCSQVLHVWESLTEQITRAEFSNGAALCGKGKHKIFTWAGIRRLDALALTDVVDTDDWWSMVRWRLVSMFYTGARNFGFKQAADTFSPGVGMRLSAFCIAGFGATCTALFPRASMFITRTIIGVTTILRTWRKKTALRTRATICLTGSLLPMRGLRMMSIWPEPARQTELGSSRVSGG
jgi:hypothetical protein